VAKGEIDTLPRPYFWRGAAEPILTDHGAPPKVQRRRAVDVRPVLNLKWHREKARLTQAELANAADFPKRRWSSTMQTSETDAKAEAVRHYLVGKNVVISEHRYTDDSRTSDDPRDRVKLEQREWYYRYLLQDKMGATEIRVTFDAMREADVDTLGHLVLDARRRKALAEAGSVWVEMAEGRPTVSLEV
jgi:hypothetical protein